VKRVVVAAVAVLLAGACGEEEPEPELAGPDFGEMEADQVMVDVEHYMTREGVRNAHLVADTVYLMDEGASAHLRHYTVDFYGDRGERTSVLTAHDGVYDMRTGDMRASDSVVVVDPDGTRQLTTEELRYDAETRMLESDSSFTLVRGRDTLRGTGFVTNPGLDSLTTRRPAVVSPPEQGSPRGSGDAEEEGDG
jgi:LPS export ABC transporter protein LptC